MKSYIKNYSTWGMVNESSIISDPSDIATATDLIQKLINRSFTKEEAAAIVGNAWVESNFNPAAIFGEINRTPKASMQDEIKFIKGYSGAYGLLQWRAERKNALADFAKEKGLHPANMKLQSDFIKYELKDSYDGKYGYETNMFKKAMTEYGTSVKQRAEGFARKSERTDSHIEFRKGSAGKVYTA